MGDLQFTTISYTCSRCGVVPSIEGFSPTNEHLRLASFFLQQSNSSPQQPAVLFPILFEYLSMTFPKGKSWISSMTSRTPPCNVSLNIFSTGLLNSESNITGGERMLSCYLDMYLLVLPLSVFKLQGDLLAIGVRST
jgi:hypothetical protein